MRLSQCEEFLILCRCQEDMQFSPKSEAEETSKINEAKSWAKEWFSAMREKNKNGKKDMYP